MQQPQMSAPHTIEDKPAPEQPDAVDDRFKTMADLLLSKRSKAERWTTKSKQQATQIFTLLARFMKDERALENMSAVKQKDLAALASFLEAEIYKHHGKSKNDKNRSISEMRVIALSNSRPGSGNAEPASYFYRSIIRSSRGGGRIIHGILGWLYVIYFALFRS
jgi:hypothetical protein